MKAERETFDRLLAHFLADRIGATFEGRISRRHPRRPVRQARRHRRRRLHPGAHHRRRIFPLSRGPPRADRRPQRREPTGSATASRCKLVEAAPVAGALRFELLSEGSYKGADRAAAQARGSQACRERARPARGARTWQEEETTMNDKQAPDQQSYLERMNQFVKRMNEVERDLTPPERAAEGCRDPDPGRPLRRGAEGAARQAPRAPQIHAGQVRVSRRRRRSRPTSACRSRSRSTRRPRRG